MVDVSDRKELEEFLRTLPHQARVSFAARATLRAAPAAFRLASQENVDSFRQKYLLTCLRANLVAATAATLTVSEINSEFDRSTRFAVALADSDDPNERGSHNYIVASRSAIFAALSAAVSTQSARHARAAAVSSRGAARSDLSADVVDSAALSLAPKETHQLFATSLWPSGAPDVLANAIRNFENSSPGTPWAFWAKWYRGMLDGKPLDWDLQRRVALIDDAIWEAGADAVAQEIARIEAELEAKPLDQDALRSHLTKLVETPLLFADSAESVSILTTEAITRFKREAETNQLPDGFAVFEQLPRVFGQISVTLRSDRDIEEKAAALQDEVNRLNTLVGQLRLDLADARLALAEALLSPAEAQRTRTFGERLQTTLTSVTLLGAMGMATLSFFGVEAKDVNYDSLKEALHGLAGDMEAVTPAPEPDTLPPSLDV